MACLLGVHRVKGRVLCAGARARVHPGGGARPGRPGSRGSPSYFGRRKAKIFFHSADASVGVGIISAAVITVVAAAAAARRALPVRGVHARVAMSSPPVRDIEDVLRTARWQDGAHEMARAELLHWYDAGHRSLPWRHEGGGGGAAAEENRAYAVWVSELMLQQTQVERVKDYFVRWMARWPTVADLAAANIDEVRAQWQGLGYYRRAQYLLDGAQQVVGEFGGRVPRTAAEWRRVKGVGEYTAGAISSIAFGANEPVVDGNVVRVFSRLLAIDACVSDAKVAKHLWSLARELVDGVGRPGDLNQALMELGATMCTPQAPKCGDCPLTSGCAALAAERAAAPAAPAPVTRFPLKAKKAEKRVERLLVCVVRRDAPAAYPAGACGAPAGGAEYLMVRRPETGLLAGLWEFPTVELGGKEGAPAERERARAALRARLAPLAGDLGGAEMRNATAGDENGVVHTFSHVQHRMQARDLPVAPPPARARASAHPGPSTWQVDLLDLGAPAEPPSACGLEPHRWVSADGLALGQLGTSNGMKKVLESAIRPPKDATGAKGAKGKRKAGAEKAQPRISKFFAKTEGNVAD